MPLYNPPQLQWNDGSGLYEYILKGGNVTAQLGAQMYALCYNDTGATVTKGQVVLIEGAQGQRVAIKLALGDSDANSAGTLGLVAESIAAGAEGWVQTVGPMYNLNTIGLTQGSLLFLSPTTAGAYTQTKPTAPDHTVIIGYVERVHASSGSIFIKVDNGYEIGELHDVVITTPTNGQVLTYDSTLQVWKNAAGGSSGTETDPVFTASPAAGISSTNISNWNSAYGWGNHASAGYQVALISGTNIKTINGNSILGAGNIAISGSGAAPPTVVTIDTGATPKNSIELTLTDSSVASTNTVVAWIQGDSTVDNSVEDHRHAAAGWKLSTVPADGSFTLYIDSLLDLFWGTFKIKYTIS